jgi:hypothetical protein
MSEAGRDGEGSTWLLRLNLLCGQNARSGIIRQNTVIHTSELGRWIMAFLMPS